MLVECRRLFSRCIFFYSLIMIDKIVCIQQKRLKTNVEHNGRILICFVHVKQINIGIGNTKLCYSITKLSKMEFSTVFLVFVWCYSGIFMHFSNFYDFCYFFYFLFELTVIQ